MSLLALITAFQPISNAQDLPPEILADRYLVKAEREQKEGNFNAAVKTLSKIPELSEKHGISVPIGFWLMRARIAEKAELHVIAVESAIQFLVLSGSNATQEYQEALELIDRSAPIALFEATKNGNAEAFDVLTSAGVDIDISDSDGNTPLHYAASANSLPIVSFLVNNAADVNKKNIRNETPLHLTRDPGIASRLLNAEAAIEVDDINGRTPLWNASVVYENIKLVEVLLNAGANADTRDRNGDPAWVRAQRNGATDIADKLVRLGADVNWISESGHTFLTLAATEGNEPVARKMLDLGAAINMVARGGTALSHATEEGRIGVVRLLIERGADVNLDASQFRRACFGECIAPLPLHNAIRNGRTDILEILADSGADLNQRCNSDCDLPIIEAYNRKRNSTLKALLDRGANANVQYSDTDGNTLLAHAAYVGNLEVVKLLLTHGAKVDTENKNSKTALQLVSKHPNADTSDKREITRELKDARRRQRR